MDVSWLMVPSSDLKKEHMCPVCTFAFKTIERDNYSFHPSRDLFLIFAAMYTFDSSLKIKALFAYVTSTIEWQSQFVYESDPCEWKQDEPLLIAYCYSRRACAWKNRTSERELIKKKIRRLCHATDFISTDFVSLEQKSLSLHNVNRRCSFAF